MNWKKVGKIWVLEGTTFEIVSDGASTWDALDDGAYLFTTRYIRRAKELCERLARSPSK